MKLLAALIALTLVSVASAQSRIVSIDAFDFAYSGGLLVKTDRGSGSDLEESTFRLNLNYAQNWEKYVGAMWRGRVFINRQERDFGVNDNLETSWGAAGGLLYNFQADKIKESFFAAAMIGLERAVYEIGSSDDEAGFNIFTDIEVGKRFDLGNYSVANISYSPTFAMTFKRYGGGIRDNYFTSGSEIKFNFLKFDVLF